MSLVTKSLVCVCDSRFNFYINFVEEVSEPTPTRELSSELSNRHDRSSIDSSSDVRTGIMQHSV
jgi:hypothetical protein